MNEFIARHAERITGVLSGFDRLVFRGTLRPISYPEGMMGYLSSNMSTEGTETTVNFCEFTKLAGRVGTLQGFVQSYASCDAGDNNRDQEEMTSVGFERRSALPRSNTTRTLRVFRGVVGSGIENHAIGHSFGNDLGFAVDGDGQRTAGASNL